MARGRRPCPRTVSIHRGVQQRERERMRVLLPDAKKRRPTALGSPGVLESPAREGWRKSFLTSIYSLLFFSSTELPDALRPARQFSESLVGVHHLLSPSPSSRMTTPARTHSVALFQTRTLQSTYYYRYNLAPEQQEL
ncbi:hypothetical protein MPTK1_5g03570 [Marchantia polymorpha subsp. ruderalis]|uniref:Uncharacterized protein n=2 Tax=Marchantia polymorpha TaxID=3197 RepID=A0AAF6BEK5_MARPO|nr:hypothetical protein Mp_5g03570 [Marchantia polymorpha subsp. ruderalis]